jgi:MoxR-like ATPase
LIQRPLLQALQTPAPGAVLLIDEVDRADEPFEAFLLEYLGEYQVSIPELGTLKAMAPPVTILTSNRTRDLNDAVKRRCLYQWMDYPDRERELAIVRTQVPQASARLSEEVTEFVSRRVIGDPATYIAWSIARGMVPTPQSAVPAGAGTANGAGCPKAI